MSSYHFTWSVVFNAQTGRVILVGLRYTLLISGLSLAFGTVLGLLVAIARLHVAKPFAAVLYMYVDFFRTTPALVQLIWIYYVLPILIHVNLGALQAGVIALSLNAGAFLSEIFRAGLQSIGSGQHDAAHVIGLSRYRTMRHVVLPQAFRRVLPAITNVFIGLLKDSSLLSVIAVGELTYQITNRVANTYRPLELYTALAVFYFFITYPISLMAIGLERRLRIPGPT